MRIRRTMLKYSLLLSCYPHVSSITLSDQSIRMPYSRSTWFWTSPTTLARYHVMMDHLVHLKCLISFGLSVIFLSSWSMTRVITSQQNNILKMHWPSKKGRARKQKKKTKSESSSHNASVLENALHCISHLFTNNACRLLIKFHWRSWGHNSLSKS